jgi:hypothetical protein
MDIIAKFQLQQVNESTYSTQYPSQFEFVFRPNYDPSIPEDQRFAKASPTGEFRITVDNPPVRDFLRQHPGKQFKIIFTLDE